MCRMSLSFLLRHFSTRKKEFLESHDNFPLTQRRKNAYEIYERVPDHNQFSWRQKTLSARVIFFFIYTYNEISKLPSFSTLDPHRVNPLRNCVHANRIKNIQTDSALAACAQKLHWPALLTVQKRTISAVRTKYM